MKLVLQNINKKFEDFNLKNVSFTVEEGDYFVLLGESGAGKSVILEIIAGLIKPDNGNIFFDGKDITNTKIQNRGIGLVFQDYAIFPNLSVYNNIAYPLKRKLKSHEIKKAVNEISKKMNIFHLLDRKPETLSGGELQRVALARTLVLKPQLLLLDEPLASLDVQLKDELRRELKKLNNEGFTIIHVTHDYYEALALANKIAITNNGEIIQVGTLKQVFHNPQSKFVANFTGIKNFYNAKVVDKDNVLLENKILITVVGRENDINGKCCAFFRAEDVIISHNKIDSSVANQFSGKIIDITEKPEGVELMIDIGVIIYALITHKSHSNMKLSTGQSVWASFKASSVKIIQK
ncbi:MAG: tungstate ABC transporter ATP-binding protein WtpC [Marinilabiliales bacterium]